MIPNIISGKWLAQRHHRCTKVFPGHSKYQNFVFDDKCGLPAIRVVQENIQGIQVSVFFVVRPVDMVTLNGYDVIHQFHGNIERS